VSKLFYTSKAWRRVSKAFMASKGYICERCGGPAGIAHHKTRLTAVNIADPAISLNPALLECLCIECHNTEHFGSGGAVAEGLCFDENGELVVTAKENAVTTVRAG
jgi:5-methylcytosine-specific restriction endonuclease McrA